VTTPMNSEPVRSVPMNNLSTPLKATGVPSQLQLRNETPSGQELRHRLAGRELLAKMIAEFAYEGLLEPICSDPADGWYRLEAFAPSKPNQQPGPVRAAGPYQQPGPVEYRFRADRGAYDCWFVDPASVRRAGSAASDPLLFLADAAAALDLPGDTAGHLVRELASTLAADLRILDGDGLSAAELADLDYARLEGRQTGHPWITFNKGRIGFSVSDCNRYAPEARQTVRLPWLAVRDDLADYRAVEGLSARQLYTEELSPAARVRFGAELIRHGCNPARYWWLPIHP
jgi:siderophore synthetase component